MAAYSAAGCDAYGYRFNVTNEEEVESAVEQIESDIGPIDILVNNAGIIRRVPLLEMPLDEWELVVKTDLTSASIVSKAVVKRMVSRGGGKVINICSMTSELGRDSGGANHVKHVSMQPVGQTRELHVPWSVAFLPAVTFTRRMYRRGRNDATTVAAQVDAGFNVCPVTYHPAWMREIHMASTAAGNRFHCLWQCAVFAL